MEFIKFKGREIPIAETLSGRTKTPSEDPERIKKAKFNRMSILARDLSALEKKLWNIIESKPNQRKFAYSILLMIECGIRSGNESSAEGYVCNLKNHELFGQTIQTFGITSLQKEHIKFPKNSMSIEFLGKKAVEQNIKIRNKKLVEWGKYFVENSQTNLWLNVDKDELRSFIKKKIGRNFLIKDFRTLSANLIAGQKALEITERENLPTKKKELTLEIKEITSTTAEVLGNTPGVCKSAYINPEIITWMIGKRFPAALETLKKRKKRKK